MCLFVVASPGGARIPGALSLEQIFVTRKTQLCGGNDLSVGLTVSGWVLGWV